MLSKHQMGYTYCGHNSVGLSTLDCFVFSFGLFPLIHLFSGSQAAQINFCLHILQFMIENKNRLQIHHLLLNLATLNPLDQTLVIKISQVLNA